MIKNSLISINNEQVFKNHRAKFKLSFLLHDNENFFEIMVQSIVKALSFFFLLTRWYYSRIFKLIFQLQKSGFREKVDKVAKFGEKNRGCMSHMHAEREKSGSLYIML